MHCAECVEEGIIWLLRPNITLTFADITGYGELMVPVNGVSHNIMCVWGNYTGTCITGSIALPTVYATSTFRAACICIDLKASVIIGHFNSQRILDGKNQNALSKHC